MRRWKENIVQEGNTFEHKEHEVTVIKQTKELVKEVGRKIYSKYAEMAEAE